MGAMTVSLPKGLKGMRCTHVVLMPPDPLTGCRAVRGPTGHSAEAGATVVHCESAGWTQKESALTSQTRRCDSAWVRPGSVLPPCTQGCGLGGGTHREKGARPVASLQLPSCPPPPPQPPATLSAQVQPAQGAAAVSSRTTGTSGSLDRGQQRRPAGRAGPRAREPRAGACPPACAP